MRVRGGYRPLCSSLRNAWVRMACDTGEKAWVKGGFYDRRR